MKTTITTAVMTVLAIATSAPAFAARDGERSSPAAARHLLLDNVGRTNQIRVEGLLSCDLGAANNGQGCDLKIREAKTGKTFNLIEARSALALYHGGTKNVIIEGKLSDPETITVANARTQ